MVELSPSQVLGETTYVSWSLPLRPSYFHNDWVRDGHMAQLELMRPSLNQLKEKQIIFPIGNGFI